MVEVSCRYFRRGFTDSVVEDETIATIGSCVHPKYRSDHPECEFCIVPRLNHREMCPGIAQKFNPNTQEFRYRCTVHRVKVLEPFTQCKSLRNCPLDQEAGLVTTISVVRR